MRSLTLSFTYSLLFFGSSLSADALDNNLEKSTFSLHQEYCQFSGSFEQVKQLEGVDQGIVSNGVFFHHCDKGVIWSTTQPLIETLVMRRDGKGFVITDHEEQQLESRQGKFLSSLLNSLMSGDQNTIEKQFELRISDIGIIQLTPRKRSLKRAIKSITVQRSHEKKTVNITIIDRNSQKTLINSVRTETYDNDFILDNCKKSISADSSICGLLLHPINKNSANSN